MATIEIPDKLIPDGYEIAEPRMRRASHGEICLRNDNKGFMIWPAEYQSECSYVILKKIEPHPWPEWLCKTFRWVALDADDEVVGLNNEPASTEEYFHEIPTPLDVFINAGVLTLPKDGKRQWKLPVIDDE